MEIKREWAKEAFKESRKETYSWPNGVDIGGGGFVEIYHTRARGFCDGKTFGGLVGEVLDDAAAGEGAACDGCDDDLKDINMLLLCLSSANSCFLLAMAGANSLLEYLQHYPHPGQTALSSPNKPPHTQQPSDHCDRTGCSQRPHALPCIAQLDSTQLPSSHQRDMMA
jgi:hypothetical protein